MVDPVALARQFAGEDRQLARTLYRTGALDRFVPEDSFAAVAAVYNQLRRARQLKGAGR